MASIPGVAAMRRTSGAELSPWWRGLRLLAALAVLVVAAGVLGGASCSTRCDDDDSTDDDDDCDDDDDSWDDDDDSLSTSGDEDASAASADWLLREFRVIPSQAPGEHPVQGVAAIRGFSLAAKLGPGVYGNAELELFTANVLHANQDLIGVQARHGRLRFDSIEAARDYTFVRYAQELVDETDAATLVPGAWLTFVFDLHGRLLEIDNATRTDVFAPVVPEGDAADAADEAREGE
jgi:hypothetical protein